MHSTHSWDRGQAAAGHKMSMCFYANYFFLEHIADIRFLQKIVDKGRARLHCFVVCLGLSSLPMLQLPSVGRQTTGYNLCIHINTKLNNRVKAGHSDRWPLARLYLLVLQDTSCRLLTWHSPADWFFFFFKNVLHYEIRWLVILSNMFQIWAFGTPRSHDSNQSSKHLILWTNIYVFAISCLSLFQHTSLGGPYY